MSKKEAPEMAEKLHYSTFEKSLAIDKVQAAIKNIEKMRKVSFSL